MNISRKFPGKYDDDIEQNAPTEPVSVLTEMLSIFRQSSKCDCMGFAPNDINIMLSSKLCWKHTVRLYFGIPFIYSACACYQPKSIWKRMATDALGLKPYNQYPQCWPNTLQWRHNELDGVSNHQPHDCLLNRLFKAQIKENIKAPRHWPLWGEFTGDRRIPRTKGQ